MSDQSNNGFAPKGLQQAAAAKEGSNGFAPTGQGDATTPDNGFAPRSWYTGANMESTANGYETPFFQTFFAQQEKLSKEGKLQTFFDQKDATGIVTWDHAGKKFGDVYENGRRVANVYETYDKNTANLMMADLTLDADAKAKAYRTNDPNDPTRVGTVIDEAVQGKRRETEAQSAKWLTQQDFQDDVNAQHAEWDNGTATGVTVAAGTAGGAITGAGIGSLLGSVVPIFGTAAGAAIGAGIGAIGGGLGAWLNQDELINQAARAKVQQEQATEQFGKTAGFFAGLSGWGGLGMKAISPASNLLHGAYDEATGDVGDRDAGWYRTDETGLRVRNGALQAADVGASLLDATGQFASGAGALAFQATMGATVAGQVGQLGATGGYTFDDRAGAYDLISRDDEGNFSLKELSAGVGSIGIDVLQLGMARGITSAAVSSSRAAANVTGSPAMSGIASRLNALSGGGGARVHAAGFSYKLDDAGRAIDGSRRISLSALAPSEAIQGLSASMRARRLTAQGGGALTADSFYRAATEMATGSRRITAALVNGFGESSEEVAQAFLEPISHGDTAGMEDLVNAGLQGFAMGVGMSIGAGSRGVSADTRLYNQAFITRGMMEMGELSRDEWNAMSQSQKQAATMAPPIVTELARAAARDIANAQKMTAVSNTAALEKYIDAGAAVMAREAGKLTTRTDAAFVITQLQDAGQVDEGGNVLEGSMPTHAVGSSYTTLRLNFERRMEGMAIQLDAVPADDAGRPVIELTLAEAAQMSELLTQGQAQIDAALGANAPAAVGQVVADVNAVLRRWFDGDGATPEQVDARRRAVTQLFIRDPQDQSGSYQLLLPQASLELTQVSANNVLQVSHGILQAIGGDYDGDKVREQAQTILNPETFANLRTGMNLLGAMGADGTSVNIMTRPYEVYEIGVLSKALATTGAVAAEARGTLARIRGAIETRYAASAIPAADVARVMDRFERDVRAGDGKARARLLDSLALFGAEMTEFARRNLTNEWQWLDQVVQANLQRFQRINASATLAPGDINTTRRPPIAQTKSFRRVVAQAAASDAITMSLRTAGHSLFRMFQALHYSSWNAPVEGTEKGNDEAIVELTAFYEMLSQDMTRTALEALDATDEITGRVQLALRKMAADAREVAAVTGQNLDLAPGLAITANALMPWMDDAGTLHTGTTATQALLAREIIRARAQYATVMTPEMSSKLARYERLTRPGQGEAAFVEVLGSVQLYELLGASAQALGSNLSLEQYTRQYVNQSELAKQDTARLLRTEPEYLGRERVENIPYQLSELGGKDPQISGYRSVIDSIIGAGNKRLSADAKGHAIGELGARNDSYQEALTEGFRRVAAAISEVEGFRKGFNRKKPAQSRAWLANLMDTNPDWARSIMALIPDSSVNAVMQVVEMGGKPTLKISPWVYDMLLMPPAEAAMHYWRNVTVAGWNALGGARAALDKTDQPRAYASIQSRFHQLLYQVANAEDGGTQMAELLTRMNESKDLKEFFEFVNLRMRGSRAPFMPWIDDVSEISPDKASSGLSAALPGALMREAILNFSDRSDRFAKSMSQERLVHIADEVTMTALADAIADGDQASGPDKALLARAQAVLDFAKEQRTTLGPGAMKAQTAGSLMHFFAHAHTKGISPWPYVPIGAFEALGDSLGYETPFGQHEAATVGTQDAEDIGGNMPMAARDSLESMTADGTPIVWEQMTLAKLVQVWKDKPAAIPAIRAILFPSVFERTQAGTVSQQFLTDKSMTDLFNSQVYEDLFAQTHIARGRYLSMVEARTRNFGGNYPIMRLANDLVHARTSSLKQAMTATQAEFMTDEAYDQIAQVLQIVGEIGAIDPGARNQALSELRETMRSTIRTRQVGAMLGLTGKNADDFTQLTLTQLLDAKRMEVLEAAQAATDPAIRDQILSSFESLKAKVELLMDSAPFERVARTYTIDWANPGSVQAKQQELVEYIRSHPSLNTHAQWAKNELYQVTEWDRGDKTTPVPVLDRKTWDTLSKAVIGTYLDTMSTITSSGISVPVFPDSDKEALLRYWDPTYSYLLDDILDPEGPLVRAAVEMQVASGRRGIDNSISTLASKLLETFYKPGSLGPWTSDIPRLSIESSHSRLAAAAAKDAVSMAGTAPRRQATESATTRRTFELPPEEAFTTGALSLETLLGNQSSGTISTGDTEMPMMRMNGRFARGATVSYIDADGQEQNLDLWNAAPVLGRPFLQDAGAAASGLRSLTINQLRAAVTRALPKGTVDAQIVLDFVHPDAQPPAGFAHNLFFEGTSFELDADGMESLNSTLWFAPGSISPNEQAKALQSNKTGKRALWVTPVQTSAQRAAEEAGWDTDFAAMLTRKTMYLMTTDLGSGRFQPAFFNAVFKRQKMRHFVRGLNADGVAELWTAEMVVAFQRANPGTALPLTQAELWKPSPRMVRTMLGQNDAEGVLRAPDGLPELDISQLTVWDGNPAAITARLDGILATNEDGTWTTADLLDTPAAQRSFQSQVSGAPALADALKAKHTEAMRTVDARRNEIHAARDSVRDFKQTMQGWAGRAASQAIGSFNRTGTGIDGAAAGVAFIGPRSVTDTDISTALYSEVHETLKLEEVRAAWVFEFGAHGTAGPIAGILNETTLGEAVNGKGPRHLWAAPDDVVVVDLDSAEALYGGPTVEAVRAAEKALIEMMKARAIIAIPDGMTGGDLRHYSTQFLREHGYVSVAGSKHLFQPRPSSESYANTRARLSTLTETRAISAQSTVAMFLSPDFPVAENAAWVLTPGQHHEVAVVVDLVPVNLFNRFNVPIEFAQVEAVQATLQNLDAAGLEVLYANMGVTAGSPEALDFDAALARLLDNWDTDPTNPKVTPRRGAKFGTGDIIPLLDAKTGDLLLLRHGHDLPKDDNVRTQLLASAVEGERGRGLAVSPTTVNSAHTTRTGEVMEFLPRSQYGLSVQMRVDLQEYGDKLVLDGSGFKIVSTPKGAGIEMPEHGIFPDWHLDLAASWDDIQSKEAYLGLVDNFRNAIAYFGADFRPELVKALFGKDLDTLPAAERTEVLNNLSEVLLATRRGRGLDVAQVQGLLQLDQMGAQLTELLTPLGLPGNLAPDWVSSLSATTATPEMKIARGVLLYLMTPGAQVEHVLESGGFNAPGARTGEGKSILMPTLFTDIFNVPATDPLRQHMFDKFNDQLHNPPAAEGEVQTGYHLANDFSFHITSKTGTYQGWLQFAEVHSSGDNPVTNEMAFARSSKQKVSTHSVDIAFQAIGAQTAVPAALEKSRAWLSGAGLETFEKPGALWDMLRDTPADDSTYQEWRELLPAEAEYKLMAREALAMFRQALSTEGWTDVEIAKFEEKRNETALAFGLTEKQSPIVDFWVRQMLGQPLGEGDQGRISYANAMETMDQEILWNGRRGYLPVHGAEVPQLHYNDLSVLFRSAEKRGPSGFQLSEGIGTDVKVTSWDDWVHVALAIGNTETDVFDPMFRLSTDGFMHSYVDALDSLVGLPVSRNQLKQEQLFDPETSRLVLSIDPNQALLLAEPLLLDPDRASLEAIMGGQRMAGGRLTLKDVPASVRARRTAARKKWRKENNVPQFVAMSHRNFRETGAQFADDVTTSNALARIAINLRVGNALFNPFLWVSAIMETGVRGALEDVTNLISGNSTGTVARVGTALAETKLGEKLGVQLRYTGEQQTKFRQLSQVLGSRAAFKGMIYRDLHFQLDRLNNAGRIERWTHNFARFGASIQDPTYGMRGDTLARRYIESVLEYMASTPMDTTLTPDALVAHLTSDPTWVQNNYPEAHKVATATIANVRSLKPTVPALMLRGIYEPLSKNPNLAVGLPSTLFLKLPLMFSTYGMNVATTVLGMQGVNAALAMFLQGRKKGLIGRAQALMEGREFDARRDETFNMDEVLEGLDLSKAFIQAGVTHTTLFAAGMMAGGLGLSGESEEDKRRRRAARYQGAGYVYDPRKIENDFRNADAVFLDWLPFGLSSLFEVTGEDSPSGTKSMANLHWMMKQFISPIVGMEKFFETGDPRQIIWGFQEAINSFPLINSAGWTDAVNTFAELQSAAADHETLGTPEALATSYSFMLKGFWTMERMLFENSFVNMLYVGTDKYDRDPWVLPLVDSNGQIQRDLLQNPRPTDALQKYVDPETGEVASGYVGRDWWSAQLHGFTENRASLAFMSSLFTGFSESTYLRGNMVPKTRVLQKTEMSQEQAEGFILSAWDTADRVIITEVDGVQYVEGGNEVLTEDGARGVFQGLWKGSVQLGDPSLEGLFIPFEMRNTIQKKWMAELVQDGVDAGLTEAKAKSRMYNIWYGPSTDPEAQGLKDILWSSDVSYARDIRYNQLNTTYVMGPDGRPWATGATRDSLQNAFGLIPVNRFYRGDVGNLGVDGRLNSTDASADLNTGMRALERVDESWYVPTPEEVGESIEKALTKAMSDAYSSNNAGGGNGWTNYGKGGGGYSRRSGGGYSSSGSFTRLNAPQDSNVPYDNSIPFINTSNPIIRRATIRRERFDSDRGRLNQWQ